MAPGFTSHVLVCYICSILNVFELPTSHLRHMEPKAWLFILRTQPPPPHPEHFDLSNLLGPTGILRFGKRSVGCPAGFLDEESFGKLQQHLRGAFRKLDSARSQVRFESRLVKPMLCRSELQEHTMVVLRTDARP